MPPPEPFCKLHEHSELGQIMVLLDEGAENGPQIRIHVRSPGFSVCCLDFPYPDSDSGLDEAREAFGAMTEQQMEAVASEMIALMAVDQA
ncbi:hypothetical protein CKO15_12900 [Halorhodospira abdelmalekii]|uniref:hypothetical protein n=1 Tax=Halorhodospira abdelmalekii TaxID=421629 RepID=UPI0019068978|nr:hypothetical protein [Halorhodospira abdelmalekii]MBK1736153.1 hypothetical protein [Halorhodospira abdelmalekii]